MTALGASGTNTLHVSDWSEQSIEVYDRAGVRLDSLSMQTRIGAIGGEPLAVFGDADGDGEIDLDDLDVLADCLTGPGSAWENHTCCLFDAEADGDVDLEDFAAFQTTLTEGTQR